MEDIMEKYVLGKYSIQDLGQEMVQKILLLLMGIGIKFYWKMNRTKRL